MACQPLYSLEEDCIKEEITLMFVKGDKLCRSTRNFKMFIYMIKQNGDK